MKGSSSRKSNNAGKLLLGIALTLFAVLAHRFLPERRLQLDPSQPGARYLLSQYGQGELAELRWIDRQNLHYVCRIPKDTIGRNCVFNFDLSTTEFGVDLSKYQTMNLVIQYTGTARYVRVAIRNFDPRFSTLADTNSPKFNSISLRPTDLEQPLTVGLHELTVAEWWVTEYDMPRELQQPDISNAVAVTIDFIEPPAGSNHEVRVEKVEFRGDWVSVENWYLGILSLWMLIAAGYGISQWFQMLRNDREQRRRLHELADSNAQLHSEKEKYQKLSTQDALTKVLNRHGVEQFVESVRAVHQTAGVIVIDLDHFKRVNDDRGHPVGDRVLQTVGDILRTHTRSTDGLGRWGGEEFVLICPGVTLAKAVDLAEKLRLRIKDTNFVPEDPLSVTASFGVAVSHPEESFEEAIRHADQALYLAKRRGRNCVVAAPEDRAQPGTRKSAWTALSGRFKMRG